MSTTQLRLASHLLKDHYGDVVEKVGVNVLRKGWTTIGSVKNDTGLAISKIRKAMCVLIQHNLVKFQKNQRGQVTYSSQLSNILSIHQYPKFTYCAKLMFGDAAELIIEELLHHGSMTMSSVVLNVTSRLLDPALSQSEQVDYHEVAKHFVELVDGHLVKRTPGDDIMMVSKGQDEANLDVVPEKNMEYDLPLGYIKSGGLGKRKAAPSDDDPAAKRRENSKYKVSLFHLHLKRV